MNARRNSICPLCKGGIFVGDEIQSYEQGYGHVNCPKVHQEPLFNPDQEQAVQWLRKAKADGELNGFTRSVLDQYEKLGSLSDRQVEVIMQRVLANRPPREMNGVPTGEVVPAGRYAIKQTVRGIEVDFVIRVWRGTRNPMAVKVYDADAGVELNFRGSRDALKAIVDQEPAECAKRYGHLRGKCARCDLPLKDRLSVELGTGPKCITYWHSPEDCSVLRADARARIRARGEDPNEPVTDMQALALSVNN